MQAFVQRPREPASIAPSSGAHGRARPVSSRPRGIAAAGHGGQHVATRHLPWRTHRAGTGRAAGHHRAGDGRSVSRPPTTRPPAGMALGARGVAPRPPTTTPAGGACRAGWSSVRHPAVHARLEALGPPRLEGAPSPPPGAVDGGAWRIWCGVPTWRPHALSRRRRLANGVEGTCGPRDGGAWRMWSGAPTWRPRTLMPAAALGARCGGHPWPTGRWRLARLVWSPDLAAACSEPAAALGARCGGRLWPTRPVAPTVARGVRGV